MKWGGVFLKRKKKVWFTTRKQKFQKCNYWFYYPNCLKHTITYPSLVPIPNVYNNILSTESQHSRFQFNEHRLYIYMYNPSIKQLTIRAMLNYIFIISVQLTYLLYTLTHRGMLADVLTLNVFRATTQRRCVVFHFPLANTYSAKFFNCNFFSNSFCLYEWHMMHICSINLLQAMLYYVWKNVERCVLWFSERIYIFFYKYWWYYLKNGRCALLQIW